MLLATRLVLRYFPHIIHNKKKRKELAVEPVTAGRFRALITTPAPTVGNFFLFLIPVLTVCYIKVRCPIHC